MEIPNERVMYVRAPTHWLVSCMKKYSVQQTEEIRVNLYYNRKHIQYTNNQLSFIVFFFHVLGFIYSLHDTNTSTKKVLLCTVELCPIWIYLEKNIRIDIFVYRPDWNASDWIEYFKTNHPNFWFQVFSIIPK